MGIIISLPPTFPGEDLTYICQVLLELNTIILAVGHTGALHGLEPKLPNTSVSPLPSGSTSELHGHLTQGRISLLVSKRLLASVKCLLRYLF